MSEQKPSIHALRVPALSRRQETEFALHPGAEDLAALARDLDVTSVRKLSFVGQVRPQGAADWRLDGQLGATVVQPCAVTLAPVSTRIDTQVVRLYQRDFIEVDAPEAEMPEDDSAEPLGRWIDPDAVMREALFLALPLYPRAPGAELGEMVYTEPGKTPLRDEDTKPFAGLAALRGRLGSEDDPDGEV